MDIVAMMRKNNELNALDGLVSAHANHRNTNIADEAYQGVWTEYESALKMFLIACKANGRTMHEPEPDTIDVSNLSQSQVDFIYNLIEALEQ